MQPNIVLRCKHFFAIVEAVYRFFSSSTLNWALPKAFGDGKDVKSYTLKHLGTRWESRHKPVQASNVQYCPVLRSLTHLKLTSHDAEVRRNATTIIIAENISSFDIHCFAHIVETDSALYLCSQNQLICQHQLHF